MSRIALIASLLLLAAPSDGVDLGSDFGVASASARQLTVDTIEVDLQVSADEDSTLVAHVVEPGRDQQTLPLAERSSGVFGILVELRRVNYIVVFEMIKPGISRQSQPLQLTDLGVAPAVLGILENPGQLVDEPTSPSSLWGWAALGLAALALLGLVVWAWPERPKTTSERENST